MGGVRNRETGALWEEDTIGSLGFADPKAGIGYAYVTSKVGTAITGDPRELALRNAVCAIIPRAA